MRGGDGTPTVALVHDYLTQQGGAERVFLAMARAFPDAPLHTSLYDPDATFPEFAALTVKASSLNRHRVLRSHHRLALPALASTFSSLHIDADVVLCSSSGWAHGVTASTRKIVYCHNPARWLYQPDEYMSRARKSAMRTIRGPLRRWDQRAAHSADLYVVNSTAVRDRVRAAYGIDPEILFPPVGIARDAPAASIPGLDPGYFLCVSRLLPYKNVTALVEAFSDLPGERLVIVGTGPQERLLRAASGPNVQILGSVDDGGLRWLYDNCQALLAASYEDFGLTPVEAVAFAKPAAVLRWGGFLDTVIDGETGVFFDDLDTTSIVDAVRRLQRIQWVPDRLLAQADRFAEPRFRAKLRDLALQAA